MRKEKPIAESTKGLIQFLESAPTSWHAVDLAQTLLQHAEFVRLHEEQRWQLKAGHSYLVIRGGAIIAFRLPEQVISRLILLAAHTDSPALKVKPLGGMVKHGQKLLTLEPYGAPLLPSWLGRDLKLAGRILLKRGKEIVEELIETEDPIAFIPPLAFHLDREVETSGLKVHKQEHLVALLGLTDDEKCDPLQELLDNKVRPGDQIISFELMLLPHQPPALVGSSGEFVASYRLDNLVSSYAALETIAHSQNSSDTLQMVALWDHEEIGSKSAVGASSPFLTEVLDRIGLHTKMDLEDRYRMRRHSLCISIDMAHAVHPGHEKKFDPKHEPLLGKGVVLKESAAQKYSTDAAVAARLLDFCQRHQLPCQRFVPRGDTSSGSTVGPIIASELGIPTLDLGAPQLSMHGARELMATSDFDALLKLLSLLLTEGA